MAGGDVADRSLLASLGGMGLGWKSVVGDARVEAIFATGGGLEVVRPGVGVGVVFELGDTNLVPNICLHGREDDC